MPMGIVSNDEFELEVSKVEIKFLPSKGRDKGDNNVPDSLRKIIGETSKIDGRGSALDLASRFNISPSSVSAYSNGSTSTATYDERPNANHINNAKERISKRARIKLMSALNHITNDKLENSKAHELSGVAKDMSAIVKNMEPDNPMVNNPGGPTFVFYSPQFRDERNFDIIHVKE